MTDVQQPGPTTRRSLIEQILLDKVKAVTAEPPPASTATETPRSDELGTTPDSPESKQTATPGGGSEGGGSRSGGGGTKDDATPEPKQRPLLKQSRAASWNAHLWFEHHAGWLTLVTTCFLLLAVVAASTGHLSSWAPPVLLTGLAAFLLSVILLFTRPLELLSDINSIFRFAWGFAVATTIFGLLFAYFGFQPLEPDADSNATNKQPAATQQPATPPAGSQSGGPAVAPVEPEPASRKFYLLAIVPGCDYDSIPFVNGVASANGKTATTTDPTIRGTSGRVTNPGMPTNVNCGELPPQWVLSIGGSILSCHFDGTCPKPPVRPDLGKLETEQAAKNRELAAQRAQLADATKRMQARDGFRQAGLNSKEIPAGNHAADIATANTSIANLTTELRALQAQIDAAKKWDQFHWNIPGSPIVGGVVIPVYFLAIALLGALVNMTRKLPEFQQRVEPSYQAEFVELAAAGGGPLPPISCPRARDLVVFQILQVLTAPAVAILAYSWAKPEELSTTVILAFAAGFSSEVFLIAIRAVVDRAIGLGPRPAIARAMVQAQSSASGDTVPPRGSPTTPPQSSGGFKVGNRVTLVKPVGPFLPGTSGVVLSIEPGGELIVQTTADHTGMPVQFRLQAQPPESFRRFDDTSSPASDPAG